MSRYALVITLFNALLCTVMSGSIQAASGDMDKGSVIYSKRCMACHGEEGDGLGPAAERLNPPPRDFTAGTYKIKTTGFDDMVPNDTDIVRMINEGMPGTAMPGWNDILSEQDILDVVAFIKTFAGYEEEQPEEQLDYGTQVVSSAESIAQGKELFLEGDRCTECHGEQGKGDAIKRLKDDNGDRTWPRNLTKPWTFRASNDPKDIFTRISIGIPGTQMPAFSDPESNKVLSIEERWHVANYVASLAKTTEVVRAENTVIKADKLDGNLPATPDDPVWQNSEPTTFFLIPQIIAEQRFFTPSNDSITVRALYNDNNIALLLEWDDRTKSIPGNEKAEKIADPDGISEDAVAIQFPVTIPEGVEKPYFGMGDASHPVNIWHWRSETTDQPESTKLITSSGFDNMQVRDAKAIGLQTLGKYEHGTWKVMMQRSRTSSEAQKDIEFIEGRFIPVSFAAWDGSNSENGSKHTMTTWYWLLLKPAANNRPLFIALLIVLLIVVSQILWVKNARNGSTS